MNMNSQWLPQFILSAIVGASFSHVIRQGGGVLTLILHQMLINWMVASWSKKYSFIAARKTLWPMFHRIGSQARFWGREKKVEHPVEYHEKGWAVSTPPFRESRRLFAAGLEGLEGVGKAGGKASLVRVFKVFFLRGSFHHQVTDLKVPDKGHNGWIWLWWFKGWTEQVEEHSQFRMICGEMFLSMIFRMILIIIIITNGEKLTL